MNQPLRSHPWQDWHLTAYVLGEFKPEAAAQIEAAALADPQLAAEIADIRRTIESVRMAIKTESLAEVEPLGQIGLQQAMQAAAADGLSEDNSHPSNTNVEPSQRRRVTVWKKVAAAVAVLASAAVLLWMLWRPGLGDRPGIVAKHETALSSSSSQASVSPASHDADVADDTHDAKANPNPDLLPAGREVVQSEPESEELQNLSRVDGLAMSLGVDGAAQGQASANRGMMMGEGSGEMGGMGMGGMGGMGMGMEMTSGDDSYESKSGYGSAMSSGYVAGGGRGGGYGTDETGTGYGFPGQSGYAGEMGGYGMGGYGMEEAARGSDMEGMGMAENSGMGGYGGRGGMMGGMGGGMGMGMGMGSGRSLESRGRYDRFGTQPADASRYGSIVENTFQKVTDQPLSTLSIDVDTASYTKCRQLLLENNQLPPVNAVRIEEFINYFEYNYPQPVNEDPLAAHLAVSDCPWRPTHKLVRIGLQAPKIEMSNRPAANLVFLLDVSGSMNEPNKLPLVKESMRMLVEQLGENDRVAMVVYAGAAGCVLESTRGDKQAEILAALDRLSAGGSTNGGDGIPLAYDIARDNYIPAGINRVILCTDGDFNVGVTGTEALVNLVVENARSKTFLTVLGYGMGNTNDEMMEQISNKGNGVYGFVDNWREAKRQMVQQLAGNLMTVAKDVKIQVEFNPQRVQAYRLLGYENRVLATEDFNNDHKDAGEIGAGHRVTALYEIVPVGVTSDSTRPAVDELRYQTTVSRPQAPEQEPVAAVTDGNEYHNELLAVKLRFKQPEGDVSQLRVFPLADSDAEFQAQDDNFRWAAAMAEFGMLLRQSQHRGNSNWQELLKRATAAAGDADASREETLHMIRRAAQLH